MDYLIPVAVLLLMALLALVLRARLFKNAYVMPGETGLLFGPRGSVRELKQGFHRWFDGFGSRRFFRVPTVRHALYPQIVEVISKDQFSFRVTLTPVVTVTDPRAFIEQSRAQDYYGGLNLATILAQTEHHFDQLGPVVSAAMLEAVAARMLEEFLADPKAALIGMKPKLEDALPGTRLDDLLVTAITMPPEVRKMFTEVERARLEGLASLERARSEQAALRALANAARSLADNPALGQLRMLQAMENAKGAKTFVVGNGAEAFTGIVGKKD